ncbi:lysyl oxidase family protein [Amycolatopsis anabasis]|uniref:lysyl oxidase family protein n=1 Tax=Amycolatopsis anabasis TaxID=1840409 RepID=UPI00131CDEBD|nr:lysyl oxidase family protein [Amycolatopsis anabasis]
MNGKRGRRSAVVLALATAALATVPAAEAGNPGLLPDLRQAPVGCPGGYGGDPARCEDWDVCPVADRAAPNGPCVTSGAIQAVRLRFTTAEENVGDGPLLLYGNRKSEQQPTMAVRQALQKGPNGGIPGRFDDAQQPTATSMYYEPAPMHQHWHLMEFERFQLRTPKGGLVVSDRKNGFCLGDRHPTADAVVLRNTPRSPVDPAGRLAGQLKGNLCRFGDPAALDVLEGISVGWADDYVFDVDYQWLDITEVPSGRYEVVTTVNAGRTLLEKDYTNNSSSIAIAVQWPGGASRAGRPITAAPTVTLLRSCPGRARCPVAREQERADARVTRSGPIRTGEPGPPRHGGHQGHG